MRGVEMSHEAVIVGDGGLSPSAALAFLSLEKLGQKKISVMPYVKVLPV